MAWYYGTFSCGHEGRVNVIGKMSERQWKVDKYFSGVCEECYKKHKAEQQQEMLERAKEYDFPPLIGTEKQVKWAELIRTKFYEWCEEKKLDANMILVNERDSRFWIDNRDDVFHPTFILQYLALQKKKVTEQQLVDMDTVRPKEIKHDGVVNIIGKQGNIQLEYGKDQDFIDLVKSYKYKWDGQVWQRKITERTGSFDDRSAEIGHALLNNGFCICIHSETIKKNAIEGKFAPEQTRWILSRIDTPLLDISWYGRNDSLYEKARKIKGSKWDNPYVSVDVSHWRSLEEFAEGNGFKFTKAAQEKIETYKRQMEETTHV